MCATNAAMGAFNWAIHGGSIFKIKKYAGLLQKSYVSGYAVKIIRAVYSSKKFLVNQLLKLPGKKKGESWGNYIKKQISRLGRKL